MDHDPSGHCPQCEILCIFLVEAQCKSLHLNQSELNRGLTLLCCTCLRDPSSSSTMYRDEAALPFYNHCVLRIRRPCIDKGSNTSGLVAQNPTRQHSPFLCCIVQDSGLRREAHHRHQCSYQSHEPGASLLTGPVCRAQATPASCAASRHADLTLGVWSLGASCRPAAYGPRSPSDCPFSWQNAPLKDIASSQKRHRECNRAAKASSGRPAVASGCDPTNPKTRKD